MDIIIKNSTGHPSNDWCIFELKREGYDKGSIIYNVKRDENTNACYWGNCVAYLGETCEEYTNKQSN